MVDENLDEKENSRQSQIEKIQAGLFLTLVTSIGVLSGFGYSVGAVKKRETKEYPKHLEKKLVYLHEQGADLARRALLRATLYTVSGFTLTCLAIWKISGANSFAELRLKIKSLFPQLARPKDNGGRTEFKNLTDLMQYVIDEDNSAKEKKKKEEP